MRKTLVLREQLSDEDGDRTELALWKVDKSSRYPQGVQYCLVFMLAGARRAVVLYANHYSVGHQRQVFQVEEPYQFSGVERLVGDFAADIARAKGRPKGA
jgi:hypothetical protein